MPTTELLILLVTQSVRHVRPFLHLVSACRERGKVQLTGQAWYNRAAVASVVPVKRHGACIAGIHHQLQGHRNRHARHACKVNSMPRHLQKWPSKAASQPAASEKKRKEKTTPVNFTRSQVLYWAAQVRLQLSSFRP